MPRYVRRRYLSLQFTCEQPIHGRDLINAVWSSILRLFGEYGASQAYLSLIEHDTKENYSIIRCSHRALEMVRASISAITKINEKKVSIQIVGVSGTLKSLRKNFLLATKKPF